MLLSDDAVRSLITVQSFELAHCTLVLLFSALVHSCRDLLSDHWVRYSSQIPSRGMARWTYLVRSNNVTHLAYLILSISMDR